MCGIAGIVNLDNRLSPQAQAIHKMADKMIARGPDDEGFLLVNNDNYTPFYGKDSSRNHAQGQHLPGYPEQHIKTAYSHVSQIALGHRRLSIVDLSVHGHQPLCSTDQRYWIVFNGEIYNYQEISKDLEKYGVYCHGHSDTEVLINAYAQWGEACLDRPNGMFAFAIWDRQKKSLFCARDRIGIKPFYYTVQNQQFIFASDIKTIIASGLYQPEPDKQGLYLAMALGMAPRPKTAFKDVFALEQSHWMRVHSNGKIQKQRYWSIPVGHQNHSMTEMQAVELLEEQLSASVRLRLVADVAVGTFMSGGVDSTTISAMAAGMHPGIKAFTLGFSETAPQMDELPQATATANMYNMQHIVKRVSSNDAIKRLDDIVAGYEEPHYGLAANHLISAMVKENNVKVVLNGLGGDELFAGYGWYNKIKLWRLLKRTAPVSAQVSRLFGHKIHGYVSSMAEVKSIDRLHTHLYSQASDAHLQQLLPQSGIASTSDYLHDLYVKDCYFSSDVEALSYMDLMSYIGNHHVHRIDQFTMAHSIEGRFPFLDHNLVEAAFSIPDKFKLQGKVQKFVLRKLAEKYIAPECLSMNKKGFSIPLNFFMRGELQDYVADKMQKLMSREVISSDVVRQMYGQYQNNQIAAKKIWHLVMLEAWFEVFID